MKRPALARFRSGAAGVQSAVDPGDAAVVVLDEVRVEARRRRHDEHLPAPRIERDDGAALRPELLLRDLLGAEIEVRDDVVPADRLALQLVHSPVDDGREIRVRGRQVVVQRALEAGARAPDGRVADDVRGQRAVGVAPEVERLAADLPGAVPREPLARLVREDETAVDRELGDAPDGVVLARREPGRGPRLPVRRHHDERTDEEQGDVGEPDDLPVHAGSLGLFARSETRRRSASRRKFETTLVPPYDTNGRVIPVSGTTRRTPPTMMNVCSAKPNVRPAASSFENPSWRLERDAHAAGDEDHEHEQQRRGAEQAELLRDRGEDEVGVQVRDQRRAVDGGERPLAEPGSSEAAVRDRVQALHELVRRAVLAEARASR